nr:hypothetical protein [Streptomyces sp. SID8352]
MLVPVAAHAAPAGAVTREAGRTVTAPVRDVLARIPVADEDRTGYQRAAFKHWTDADKDGCNTRAEALRAEAVVPPTVSGRCTLSGGEWYSPYGAT